MTTGDGLGSLAAWLEPRLDHATDLRLQPGGTPGSGFSAETTILLGEWREGGEHAQRAIRAAP